ncbi:MAG TPA: ABC transporter substrate-binding protein [Acidimicrobiales bacterium]|jgi:putative spermidine/putrescine transport system substrate-binding protein|nr:ABC transporter substrate-binding protein [Acidimicrobiales bacterium]
MKIRPRAYLTGAAALTIGVTLSGILPPAGGAGAATSPAKATSAAALGGMSGLVKAAKKEGKLNVITLPADWANYGNIIKDFTKKYGIKITSENPDGSSQDEINAVNQLKGQSRAPDVLDMGTAFAITAAKDGLLAPYKVASWSSIPSTAKASNADWWDDYGGYVAIGYNPKVVTTPPTSFKDLLKPIYKNQVAINGNPTQASAAFSAVYAAALANGGSLNNIQPGIDFFQKLSQAGNFVPVQAGASTVESGQTPIVIWWDYLQASEIAAQVPGWKIVIPTDGHYAAYYSQAISATAPHPAAARLWEEYLYSVTGQNLWLQGAARPIELATLVKNKTVDQKAYAALPPAPKGNVTFPSEAQMTAAQTLVTQNWASATGG